jgi:DNA mismatch repair protein MutS2
MPFALGAAVTVRPFGNKRGVITAIGRNGRYEVRIDKVTMWCGEVDLAVAPEPRKKGSRGHGPQGKVPDDVAVPGRVDLHGLVVEEALARVVEEIDRSLLRGADRVEVVHGKGSGRVREALHRQLGSLPVVARFHLDPDNPGVTWIYFR